MNQDSGDAPRHRTATEDTRATISPQLTNVATASIQNPPTTVGGILSRLGPGVIIAASIVGSGELIATTKTGAEAGFTLLWLILLGCVIKVFASIEFGRYTITEGRTSIDGMNQVPGPRLGPVNWLVWYWLIMFSCSTSQLGGIVGVVGESLAIPIPITGDVLRDSIYWSTLVTVITATMLIIGRYGLVQSVSAFLVAGFTLVTILNVIALDVQQVEPRWHFTWDDILHGLSLRLPEATGGITPVATALAAFGIIGVGASEIIAYPYWCLEKGYARWTGPRDQSESWARRARGWLRVMRWDSWFSMLIYTIATLAFYILGAAVLNRAGAIPSNDELVSTLLNMYVPVFGVWAKWIFLFGTFAVLYSTFFVATAGNARIAADGVRIFRVGAQTDAARLWWTRLFCGLLPFISLGVYIWTKLYAKHGAVTLVLISGVAQAIMLPMLGGAALYFRHRRCDPRIAPGKLWDALLWLSFIALLITGVWGASEQTMKVYKSFSEPPAESATE